MPKKNVDTIILEPFTPIISFQAISHRTYKSVAGAVGHYKFPDDQEYKARSTAFFKSRVGRKNQQKISEVISETYAYLNTRISEHADPADYYFRLWLKLEVDRETAEIIGNPSFDIDVFRHIGKIGGKHSNVGNYLMDVVLVDKETSPLSPIFKKGANKAKTETGLLEVTTYESYTKVPAEVKEKISKGGYFLIIDEDPYKIEPELDSKTGDVFYKIKENGAIVEFRSEDDVFNYILKKVKIVPKIISSETGLSLVDKEIVGISKELEKAEPEPKTDLIAELAIEENLKSLFNKLDDFKARVGSEKRKEKDRLIANLEELKKEFDSLKVDFGVHESELENYTEEYHKQAISEDSYRTYRFKALRAMGLIKTKLIDLQKSLKETCPNDINKLIGAKATKVAKVSKVKKIVKGKGTKKK